MKIALIPNLDKPGANEITVLAIERLKAKGHTVYISTEGFDAEIVKDEDIYRICDIVITVGGDGTIIRSAKKAARYNKPVLGINAGRLGFLADLNKDNLELLDRISIGEYKVTPRFMIEAKVYSNGKLITEGIALNDAVISPDGTARLLDLEVKISNDSICYRSDGVIVSTPTGSTAYSMSAGGPVISPNVRCFAVTPICSHSLTARPMIVGEESKINIRLPDDSEDIALFSLDGRVCCRVDRNVEIVIQKAPYDAKLISLTGNDIFKTLSQKFRW